MLKAVRFDPEKHKEILNFITNYKDQKGRHNESEAIRFLMQSGFDSINNSHTQADSQINTQQNNKVYYNKQSTDIDLLKKELLKELKGSTNNNDSNINMDSLKKELLQELKGNNINDSNINIDSLKKELLNDVLSQINNQTLNSLNSIVDKLNNIPAIPTQPVYQPQQNTNNEFTEINTPKPQKPKPQIEIPADTNSLLANLLANSNR